MRAVGKRCKHDKLTAFCVQLQGCLMSIAPLQPAFNGLNQRYWMTDDDVTRLITAGSAVLIVGLRVFHNCTLGRIHRGALSDSPVI